MYNVNVALLGYSNYAFLRVKTLGRLACAGLAVVGFALSLLGLSTTELRACGSGYGCGARAQTSHHYSQYHAARALHVRGVNAGAHSSSLPSSQHMQAVALANNPYAHGSSTGTRGHYGYSHGSYGHGYGQYYGYPAYHQHAYAPTMPYFQPHMTRSVMDLPVSLGIRPAPTPEPVIYSIHRDGSVSRRHFSHVKRAKIVRKGDVHIADTAQVETSSGARIIYIR